MEKSVRATETGQDFESFKQMAGLVSQKEKREQRDLEVYNDYQLLLSQGKLKGDIIQFLMHKYDIGSHSTIYIICDRVEKRLKEKGGKA